MMARNVAVVFASVLFVGCSASNRDATTDSTSAPTEKSISNQKPPTPTHKVERLALDFIDVTRNDAYSESFAVIAADSELPPGDRIVARQKLTAFVKSQNWNLWFTSINVVDGKEDSVDCYLRGSSGGLLVLMFGFHYDINKWRIAAYEIPEVTFARPENESYSDYVTRSISESRANATPYKNGVQGDGRYFIEYEPKD